MAELVVVLMAWTAVAAGLPLTADPPGITFASRAHLAALYHRDGDGWSPNIEAIYEPHRQTIILGPGWQASDPVDVSVLVHELVHHLQHKAGMTFACPEEREALAYAVQAQWLAVFGLDLERSFDIDDLTLLLRTKCLPH